MSMANVTKTTRIQAIAELQKRKTEIQNRLQNGQSQDSTTIGGNSFTEDVFPICTLNLIFFYQCQKDDI